MDSPIDAFLGEVAATHRLCDSDPRITATDHVVLAMWEQLGTAARAHLLLRFARAAVGTLTDLSVAWDEAGEDAHWLYQATPAGTELVQFAGAGPGDVPGLRHQAARIALRLAADPEAALSLTTALILYAAASAVPPAPPPPPRRAGRPGEASGRWRPPAAA